MLCQGLLDGKDTALQMRLTRAQKDMLRLQTEGHLNLIGMELAQCSIFTPEGARTVDCIKFKPTWREAEISVVFADL
jgi:hypothetical protein